MACSPTGDRSQVYDDGKNLLVKDKRQTYFFFVQKITCFYECFYRTIIPKSNKNESLSLLKSQPCTYAYVCT